MQYNLEFTVDDVLSGISGELPDDDVIRAGSLESRMEEAKAGNTVYWSQMNAANTRIKEQFLVACRIVFDKMLFDLEKKRLGSNNAD